MSEDMAKRLYVVAHPLSEVRTQYRGIIRPTSSSLQPQVIELETQDELEGLVIEYTPEGLFGVVAPMSFTPSVQGEAYATMKRIKKKYGPSVKALLLGTRTNFGMDVAGVQFKAARQGIIPIPPETELKTLRAYLGIPEDMPGTKPPMRAKAQSSYEAGSRQVVGRENLSVKPSKEFLKLLYEE